jgi:hypothetical protein
MRLKMTGLEKALESSPKGFKANKGTIIGMLLDEKVWEALERPTYSWTDWTDEHDRAVAAFALHHQLEVEEITEGGVLWLRFQRRRH